MTPAIDSDAIKNIERIAETFAQSRLFSDTPNASQAFVKILAGNELGFGPFASMTGIHIIKGRPSIGANLMSAAVKRSGRYGYRVTELNDKVCRISFFERDNGERVEIGESKFDLEDARKAGTQNLGRFPRNMLFARCMSNGVRFYCPDVFDGTPVYTPEELGAEVDDEGNVFEDALTSKNGRQAPPSGRPAAQQAAKPPKSDDDELDSTAAGQMHASITEKYGKHVSPTEHLPLASRVLGREIKSFRGMLRGEAKRVLAAARALAIERQNNDAATIAEVINPGKPAAASEPVEEPEDVEEPVEAPEEDEQEDDSDTHEEGVDNDEQ